MSDIRRILDFWFAEQNRPRWFKKDAAFDDEIRARFAAAHDKAAQGGLGDWQNSPEGSLALILTLDQFPRNMFRGSARAVATDPAARAVADWAIDKDFDRKFATDDERIFFYLPFEHSEDIGDQHRAVELVRTRISSPDYQRYAVLHFEAIAKFGRFPHRNAILGRRDTPDEEEYLKRPGAGF